MKSIHVRKLEGLVGKHNVVVAHFKSDRCIPCNRNEKYIQKSCSKYEKYGIKCVSIDVDKNQKGIGKLKKLGITRKPTIIPATMIYVNGNLQYFQDNKLLGGRTKKLVGERQNIDVAIRQAIKYSHTVR